MRKLMVVLCGIMFVAAGTRLALAQHDEFEGRFVSAEVVSAEPVVYPANALRWGTTVLQVTIERDGSLGEVKVVRDSAPFTKVAEQSIKKWKFKPARLDGKPVRSTMPIAFTFSIPPSMWPSNAP